VLRTSRGGPIFPQYLLCIGKAFGDDEGQCEILTCQLVFPKRICGGDVRERAGVILDLHFCESHVLKDASVWIGFDEGSARTFGPGPRALALINRFLRPIEHHERGDDIAPGTEIGVLADGRSVAPRC
jgi:hypothetical protein